jgi:hypothetical protein
MDNQERVYVEREDRTFETRLQFIDAIFSNRYERHQIMASCINYKLDQSYEVYLKDIHKSLWLLNGKNPLTILKKIDG